MRSASETRATLCSTCRKCSLTPTVLQALPRPDTTEASLKLPYVLFQATNKLSIDGKAGKQTIGLLTNGGYKKASEPITSGSVGSSPSADKVADLIAIARTKLGAPYVRGAKGPNSFDCSGFVYWVINQAGIRAELPYYIRLAFYDQIYKDNRY